MPSRNAQLIRYFVEQAPKAGRTRIAKFLYMADLEARRYLGKPLTDLNYRWDNHGPYDPRIARETAWLADNGFIEEFSGQAAEGYTYYQYTATSKAVDCLLKREEEAILAYVLKNFADMKLNDLLEEVVYQTPPMRAAKSRGEMLQMELVDNQDRIPGLELENILESTDEFKAGGGEFFEDILAGIPECPIGLNSQDTHHPNSENFPDIT